MTGSHKKLPRYAMNSSSVGVQHASRDSYRKEGDRGLPPPPPLNQHKYSINSSKVTTVAAKRYATVQKHLEFLPKAYSRCQSIGLFPGRWGASDGPPPLSKNLHETLMQGKMQMCQGITLYTALCDCGVLIINHLVWLSNIQFSFPGCHLCSC